MTSKQRAYLRGLTNKEDAVLQVGKNGTNENLIKQVSDILEARELIKISILETAPEEKKEVAETIANQTSSEIVQIIGNKISLYRKSKKPKIILP